ncbi:T9SS type A sorting domain-containing protein [Parapedobacter sp.]
MSWTGDGATDNRRRLDHWLSPGGGTAPNTVDGKAATTLAGPSTLCASETFTATGLPTGATVSWSVSGTYTIVGSSTANPVTVQPTASGNGVLTATITSSCGSFEVTKPLSGISLEISPTPSSTCGSATVSVDAGAGTYSWTVTGDLSINGGGQTLVTSSNTIQVDGVEGGNISVTITGACASTVNLGEYYSPYGAGDGTIGSYNSFPMLPGDPLTAYIQDFAGEAAVVEYHWYLNGNLVLAGPSQEYNSNIDGGAWALQCDMNTLQVEAMLDCGETVSVGELPFERMCFLFRVYPNPANETLTVSVGDDGAGQAQRKARPAAFTAILYDHAGTEHRKGESKDGTAVQFNTTGLPEGTYFVHIHKDGEVEKRQVVIRH